MQLIADWLEKLGMSEYAKAFAENRIDFSVLPDLTDQDLEKLGVLLGDRRKMLRAIANLDNTPAAPPRAAASAPSLTVPPLPEAAGAGERRYLTVMFCDLVDFDRHRRAARRRGMARSRQLLSRCRHGGGDGDGRACRQEARRRADGAVRLPGGA